MQCLCRSCDGQLPLPELLICEPQGHFYRGFTAGSVFLLSKPISHFSQSSHSSSRKPENISTASYKSSAMILPISSFFLVAELRDSFYPSSMIGSNMFIHKSFTSIKSRAILSTLLCFHLTLVQTRFFLVNFCNIFFTTPFPAKQYFTGVS